MIRVVTESGSISALEAIVTHLRACAPAPYSASEADQHFHAEALVSLAIRIASALKGLCLWEECDNRAKQLSVSLDKLDVARKSAHAALMSQLQPDAKQPPRRTGFYIVNKDRSFPVFLEPADVELYLGDASSLLLHLPLAIRFVRKSLRWRPNDDVEAFAKMLWELWQLAGRDYSWGHFLISRCHAVDTPDKCDDLIALFASLPETFRAITEAAESTLFALHARKQNTARAVPVLSERQYLILQAMQELEAVTSHRRLTTAEIAKRAENSVDADAFKEPTAQLCKLRLIETKAGRGGGCWLTADGLEVARRLVGKQ